MRWVLTGMIILVLSATGYSQVTFEQFKQQSEGYYHYLATPDINNFSCKISSGRYIEFIKDKGDSSYYYPLKFIWTKEGSVYYILQPLPQLSDSLHRVALTHAQTMKNFFSDMLYGLQKFYLKNPLSQIPANAAVNISPDTIAVTVRDSSDGEINETYTRGGQLGRVIWKSSGHKVVSYPLFTEVQQKWLCMGWRNQIYQQDQIVSGMSVQIEHTPYQERFLPARLSIVIQERKEPDQKIVTGGYVLYLRDFMFNENITEIATPKRSETDSSKPQ
jgi:hypothetical protein